MEDKVKEWLGELNDILKKRKSQYKGAIVSGSLVFGRQGLGISKLEILFGDKEFLGSAEDGRMDYGNCRLVRTKINMADAQKLIKDLSGEEDFEFDGESIDVKPYDPSVRRLSSSETPHKLGWPCHLFHAGVQQSGSTHLDGPLLSVDQPLFPYLDSAEREWLFFGEAEGDRQRIYGMGVVLPDFRARLGSLEIGADRIKVEIEVRQAKRDGILGKWFVDEGQRVLQEDFEIAKNEAVISTESFPDTIHVYLLDRESSEGLDWRSYWSGREDLEPGVSFEIHDVDIEVLLRQGENQFIEYKSVFNPKISGEFHETISAFANTKGGVILVGVDDNGAVVGVEDSKLEDRITDSIGNSVEPLPDIEFERRSFQGMEVLLVSVDVGENPPYMVDGRAYVRSGGTDRRVGRLELDTIYERKIQQSPYPSVYRGW